MTRQAYNSDLSDEQWAILEAFIPPGLPGGRPREADMREVVNAMLYILRTGASWRQMPHDLPKWPTVYTYYRAWQRSGLLEFINDRLREAVREAQGRTAQPSAAIIDSQSVKTSERGGHAAMTATRK